MARQWSIWSCHVDGNMKTPQRGATTTIRHHHHPPMTATAHHFHHNGHQCPPPRMATYLIRSIIYVNSPTKWLTCHANGPSRHATSTSAFRAHPCRQALTTMMLHNHRPSPMTATAYHNHNQKTTIGHEFPLPMDGDGRPQSPPLERQWGMRAPPAPAPR